jgi:hypothetical protein
LIVQYYADKFCLMVRKSEWVLCDVVTFISLLLLRHVNFSESGSLHRSLALSLR